LVNRIDNIVSVYSHGYSLPLYRTTIVRYKYLPENNQNGLFSFLKSDNFPVRVKVYQQQAALNKNRRGPLHRGIRYTFVAIYSLLIIYGLWSLYQGIKARTVRFDLRNAIFVLALLATIFCLIAAPMEIDSVARTTFMSTFALFFNISFYLLFQLWGRIMAIAEGHKNDVFIIPVVTIASIIASLLFISRILYLFLIEFAKFIYSVQGIMDLLIATGFLLYGIRFLLRRKQGMFVSPPIQQALKKLAILSLVGATTYVAQSIHNLFRNYAFNNSSIYIYTQFINYWLFNAVRATAFLLVFGVNVPERQSVVIKSGA